MNLCLPDERILVISLLGAPGIKLPKTTLRENLTNEYIQSKTLELLGEKFEPDGIFRHMDFTVETEVLGLNVSFPENDSPNIRNHWIKTLGHLKSIKRTYKGIFRPGCLSF